MMVFPSQKPILDGLAPFTQNFSRPKASSREIRIRTRCDGKWASLELDSLPRGIELQQKVDGNKLDDGIMPWKLCEAKASLKQSDRKKWQQIHVKRCIGFRTRKSSICREFIGIFCLIPMVEIAFEAPCQHLITVFLRNLLMASTVIIFHESERLRKSEVSEELSESWINIDLRSDLQVVVPCRGEWNNFEKLLKSRLNRLPV